MSASSADAVDDPVAPSTGNIRTEWLLRVFALMAYGFAVRNLAAVWWADRSRLTLLLLLLSEGFTLMLVLLAQTARHRDTSWAAVLLNVYAAFSYVLFDPRVTTPLIPETVGAAFQVCGTLWQLAAKVAIGRSFGVLPALRGVVIRGPYRVVRHPIYLGYLVGHIGFLLVNFSWRNLIVLSILYGVQVLRITREEAILATNSADYRLYRQRVRWRLIPFIY
jgi:protein-S-isoprenylcysteine O-methyltransferase Ste14